MTRRSLADHLYSTPLRPPGSTQRDPARHARPAPRFRIGAIDLEGGSAATLIQWSIREELNRTDREFWRLAQSDARWMYEGIARYWSSSGNPTRLGVGLIKGTAEVALQSPVPDTRTSTVNGRMRRLGRSIWPDGRLPDDKVDWSVIQSRA